MHVHSRVAAFLVLEQSCQIFTARVHRPIIDNDFSRFDIHRVRIQILNNRRDRKHLLLQRVLFIPSNLPIPILPIHYMTYDFTRIKYIGNLQIDPLERLDRIFVIPKKQHKVIPEKILDSHSKIDDQHRCNLPEPQFLLFGESLLQIIPDLLHQYNHLFSA